MRKKALLAAAGLSFGLAAREWYLRQRESSLEAQVVLITGGSRGLGLALAHEFARQGCRLAICARNEEELARARHELEQQGATVLTVKCDISDQAQVAQMIDQVTRHYDGLDILVNNAGIITAGPVENMALQDFEEAMQIMYWGVVYPTLAVLPQMQRRRSGRIVNITSIGGKVAMPHLLPYSSAKFAAVAFSEGLRSELAKDGINVNTICPGLMRTGSYVNVRVKGQQDNEFILLSLLDNLPGISISVESAARRIVQATRRNEAEVVLSLPAKVQALFHGVFPGLTSDMLGIVARFLPKAPEAGTDSTRGKDIQERLKSPWFDSATGLGLAAARRFNQPVPQHCATRELNGHASKD